MLCVVDYKWNNNINIYSTLTKGTTWCFLRFSITVLLISPCLFTCSFSCYVTTDVITTGNCSDWSQRIPTFRAKALRQRKKRVLNMRSVTAVINFLTFFLMFMLDLGMGRRSRTLFNGSFNAFLFFDFFTLIFLS